MAFLPSRQPLSTAPLRAVWRRRPSGETEPCVLEGQLKQVRLRSFAVDQQVNVVFKNQTSAPVRVIWLNYEGNEVPYSILKPGESMPYGSFIHPWIVRDVTTARRCCLNKEGTMCVLAADGLEVTITEPPLLPWQASSHAAFPADFKAAVRQTLLCANRLGGSRCCSSSSSNAAAVGSAEHVDMEQDEASSSWARSSELEPATTTGRNRSATLGSLPQDLLLAILCHLVPQVWQDPTLPGGHPDIAPCCWTNPTTFAKMVAETEAGLAAQAAKQDKAPPRLSCAVQ